jgi:N-formylmaleamate deformylase
VQPGDKIDMAADLAGLVRGLGLAQIILGGHSMGASTAALTEARFPGLTHALILEDPAWFIPQPPDPDKPEQPRQNPFEKWLQTMAGKTVEELIAYGHLNNPTWPEIELRPWAESKMQFDMNTFSAAREPGMDWRDAVKLITCPTLLITAENDKGSIVTPQAAQLAVELNSKIRVVNIRGAGHNIRRENYDDYMKAIRAFLRGL